MSDRVTRPSLTVCGWTHLIKISFLVEYLRISADCSKLLTSFSHLLVLENPIVDEITSKLLKRPFWNIVWRFFNDRLLGLFLRLEPRKMLGRNGVYSNWHVSSLAPSPEPDCIREHHTLVTSLQRSLSMKSMLHCLCNQNLWKLWCCHLWSRHMVDSMAKAGWPHLSG